MCFRNEHEFEKKSKKLKIRFRLAGLFESSTHSIRELYCKYAKLIKIFA